MGKAIRIYETGGPDVMKFEDVETGEPGPGQVRLRHRAIGLNFIDVYFRDGLYKNPLPFTPGNEGAGDIVAVGKGVKGFKIGDRVAYCSAIGAYAQERLIDVKTLVKLPKNISYEQGAAMMLKGLTAQYLLRQTFRVKKGHVILVHAAAGGVGQLLCQWGKALGATVIATAGSPDKLAITRKAGAKHLIDYSKENFVERVLEITKGGKCDVVYDGVGKATFMGSLDCLKPFGLMVSFGNASGPVDAFNLGILSQKGSLFVTRPTLYTFAADRKRFDAMAKDLFKAVAAGKVKIKVTQRFALADAVAAHRALEARETTGATVLIP
ncbi:MAG: quinone oxidoreductase [Alphaproteobacteria bacterium]|nr:quinone oxidoreductase [Alphaproteobacteria bacterium]